MALEEILKWVDKKASDIRDLFLSTGVVMGCDYIIPLPSDYNNGMAPGFDLAIGSGLLSRYKSFASLFGAALSMTPELVNFVNGGDYGELSTRALTKGAVYGLSSLVAYGYSVCWHWATSFKKTD